MKRGVLAQASMQPPFLPVRAQLGKEKRKGERRGKKEKERERRKGGMTGRRRGGLLAPEQ